MIEPARRELVRALLNHPCNKNLLASMMVYPILHWPAQGPFANENDFLRDWFNDLPAPVRVPIHYPRNFVELMHRLGVSGSIPESPFVELNIAKAHKRPVQVEGEAYRRELADVVFIVTLDLAGPPASLSRFVQVKRTVGSSAEIDLPQLRLYHCDPGFRVGGGAHRFGGYEGCHYYHYWFVAGDPAAKARVPSALWTDRRFPGLRQRYPLEPARFSTEGSSTSRHLARLARQASSVAAGSGEEMTMMLGLFSWFGNDRICTTSSPGDEVWTTFARIYEPMWSSPLLPTRSVVGGLDASGKLPEGFCEPNSVARNATRSLDMGSVRTACGDDVPEHPFDHLWSTLTLAHGLDARLAQRIYHNSPDLDIPKPGAGAPPTTNRWDREQDVLVVFIHIGGEGERHFVQAPSEAESARKKKPEALFPFDAKRPQDEFARMVSQLSPTGSSRRRPMHKTKDKPEQKD